MTRKTGKLDSSNPESDGQPPKPLTGIDRDNFLSLGMTFMRQQGGRGFVIVRDANVRVNRLEPGQSYAPSPRQWGAWMAWRKSKGLPCEFLKSQGYGTVPAEWPHLFDAEWPEHRSHDAANRWQDRVMVVLALAALIYAVLP